MLDPLASQVWTCLSYLPSFVLLWLAFSFGNTLRQSRMPLIEQVARCGGVTLSAALCHYTRWLTCIWCAYFLIAAAGAAWANASGAHGYGSVSLVTCAGTALLFVGERWLRPLIFPNEAFPGLMQQVRDTWSVWRPRRGAAS